MKSDTSTHRPRRRQLAVLVAALAIVCALPTAASAATVQFNSDEVLLFGTGEERNNVSVREVAGALIVTDTAGLFHPPSNNVQSGNRCASIDRQTMRCPLKRFEASMGNGDDTAGPMNTRVPVEINGGEGDDTYLAGSPSFLTNVEFVGGSDRDTASYAGSGGASGGRGVRIANDGLPNDGRAGLDTDNIGRDVEVLIGSAFADDITGTADAKLQCCNQLVSGGPGADVLRAGAGPRLTIFDMGRVADGADRIIAGSGSSTIHYDERVRPVNATLNFGGADDGEAGEGDEIIGVHEQLIGGSAGDTLRAPAGSTAGHNILGLGGNDQIDGANGNDTLSGDAGRDTVRGLGGDDRVFAKDGESDTVDCGLQTDTVEVDSIDNFGNCENGTIGVLRLARKTLEARPDEVALLGLSWRHPRSWRELRSVELRLYRGKARVGAIAISPSTGRITDRGAVELVRRSTRITHKGKTVHARLALRLARKLAGRRLRVEVEAVDVAGVRQLERRAGSIRVSR
jgi:RTX calcium-binding nonapeptide repeat (4 copies)